MLTISKFSDSITTRLQTIEQDCWINLADPTTDELHLVKTALGIPADFFIDSLDIAERAHLRLEGENVFMAVRASYPAKKNTPTGSPREHNADGPPFFTIPIGIILTPTAIITVCRSADVADSLLAACLHNVGSQQRLRLALLFIRQVSINYIEHLSMIDEHTTQIEIAMRRSMRNEELARMLHIEKTLVYFMTALKANGGVLEKMLAYSAPGSGPASASGAAPAMKLTPEEHALLVDTITECRQATETAEVYTQIIGSMSETFASMISNNMNRVMKFLAGITLILMAPTIIVGLFGMNVPLPWQESKWALPFIGAGTLALCLALWRYLVRKDWM